jgi:uncharacterized protein YbaR (Trm112 family)
MRNRIFFIKSKESSVCPICSGTLKVRDTKQRKLICTVDVIVVKWYRLRRLVCESCGKLHTELPDCMQPYKQYEADAIQAEIDGSQENPHADDNTLKRWRNEFRRRKDQIEGAIRALWSKHYGIHYPLLKRESLLESLRKNEPCWLRLVNKAMINKKFPIHTRFAFCPWT